MRRRLGLMIVFSISVLIGSNSVHAKGSPDLIVLKGNGLSKTIEIKDQPTLKSFDPWRGQFIDWKYGVIDRPAILDRCFDVSFFMKWQGRHSTNDRGDLKYIYGIEYCAGLSVGDSTIFLPAQESSPVNAATILRDGDDGKWHRASEEWDCAMLQLINQGIVEDYLSSLMVGPQLLMPTFRYRFLRSFPV